MNYTFLVIGGTSVGKTAWLYQIAKNIYDDKYSPSLIPQSYEFNHKKNKLTCIDIPGISIDKHVNQLYDNIDGIFLMCDMTGKGLDTLTKIKITLNNLYPTAKYILIINKLDVDVDDEINFDVFCKDNDVHSLHAMSVKDNHATLEPIDKMIELIKDYKTIHYFKPNEVDNFIINFLHEIEKCTDDNTIKIKIKYILLLCHNKHININLDQFIDEINKLFIGNTSLHDILNYIIKLY